jgi:adenylate cyclase
VSRKGSIRRRYPVWILAALALLAGITAQLFPTPLDLRLLDLEFNAARAIRPQPLAPDVTIVGIDDDSYRALPEPFALWHPHLGHFFAAMAQLRPSAVAIDIVLPDHSYDALVPGYDRALLSGIVALRQQQVPLALAQGVEGTGKLKRMFPPLIALAGEQSFGAIALKPDADGIIRRVTPDLEGPAGRLPTLSSRVIAGLGATPAAGLIDYAAGAPLNYVPLQQVLDWQARGELQQHRQLFDGRAVFLGAVDTFTDRHMAPVALAAWEPGNRRIPGVMIHAQIVRSQLARGLIRPVGIWLLLALHLLALLAWTLPRGARRVAFCATLPLLLCGLSLALLLRQIYLPVFGILAFAYAAVAARMVHEQYQDFQERQRLRQVFGPSVSQKLLARILAGEILPQEQGREVELCVLMADVRSFTVRSMNSDAGAIVQLLSRYFTRMSEAIHAHDGVVDKFIGDGLLAFFGEPDDTAADPCVLAFDAVAQMRENLQQLNDELVREGIEPVRIRVGLEFGRVIVGFVGSAARREYTVIGDAVNMAARIEGLNKKVQPGDAAFCFLCSSQVHARLDEARRRRLQAFGEQAVDGGRLLEVYGYAY